VPRYRYTLVAHVAFVVRYVGFVTVAVGYGLLLRFAFTVTFYVAVPNTALRLVCLR